MKHILFFSEHFFQPLVVNSTAPLPFSGTPPPHGFLSASAEIVLLTLIALLLLFGCLTLRLLLKTSQCAKTQRRIASDRLMFIRSILDLCYTYQDTPDRFMTKFKDKVHIRELKPILLPDADDFSIHNDNEKTLQALLDRGFTPRELCVLYGYSRIGSLYVRCYRIKKKQKK